VRVVKAWAGEKGREQFRRDALRSWHVKARLGLIVREV
jgi:hypothetical protein